MIERPVGRPVHRSSYRRALASVAVVLLTLSAPAAAQAGVPYAVRPAPGAGDHSSGGFNVSVRAGSAASDAVQIFNLTDDPASFDVYAADAVPKADGGLVPAAREAQVTGPAAWITVDQATVEVPPKSSVIVSFIIGVPLSTPFGAHTAALLVEPQHASGSGAITSKTRVALWVRVKVTGVEGEVLGDMQPPSGLLWLLLILMGLAFLAWLTYVTRDRRRRWVQERREERALLRDFRNRRRHD